MMSILMFMNMTITLMFLAMNHPLSMGMMLLLQTTLISLITGNFNQNMWFSYILFLILIGGMLILFMYMTSIASNEKFKTMKPIWLTIMIIPISSTMMIPNQMMKTSTMMNESSTMENQTNLYFSMSKFINTPMSTMLLFLMIYLFLTLVATVKITSLKQGPLRQMN